MYQNTVKLIECPRDAMQGWTHPISTASKIEYINALLKVGFDTIDFGSFVSPKAIPQMADTTQVLKGLNLSGSDSRLLAIIANIRGATEAVSFDEIHYLGFPFSVSETFQQRNTNSSIAESLKRVEEIQTLCAQRNKELVIYLSMGFGNPYGDPYSPEIVFHWARQMNELGVRILSLADTVGLALPAEVFQVTEHIVKELPQCEVGVHLHSTSQNWHQKLEAALQAGAVRVDGALKGIGGCPMANDELVGNMDTELMIPYLQNADRIRPLNQPALEKALQLASEIFR